MPGITVRSLELQTSFKNEATDSLYIVILQDCYIGGLYSTRAAQHKLWCHSTIRIQHIANADRVVTKECLLIYYRTWNINIWLKLCTLRFSHCTLQCSLKVYVRGIADLYIGRYLWRMPLMIWVTSVMHRLPCLKKKKIYHFQWMPLYGIAQPWCKVMVSFVLWMGAYRSVSFKLKELSWCIWQMGPKGIMWKEPKADTYGISSNM